MGGVHVTLARAGSRRQCRVADSDFRSVAVARHGAPSSDQRSDRDSKTWVWARGIAVGWPSPPITDALTSYSPGGRLRTRTLSFSPPDRLRVEPSIGLRAGTQRCSCRRTRDTQPPPRRKSIRR